MKIIWGKPKRHKPNPKKVHWNRLKRNAAKLFRNMALIAIFGSALAVIIFM